MVSQKEKQFEKYFLQCDQNGLFMNGMDDKCYNTSSPKN